MAQFDLYIPLLFRLEGRLGLVTNHPTDKGGLTNAGVTIKTFRQFFGQDRTADDLRNMTYEQWYRIMKSYWDDCKGDRIRNQSIAELVVDWNINSGITGMKEAQRCLNLVADGVYGPKTLTALNSDPQKCVFCRIMDARKAFFKRLASASPSQAANLNGWLNRLKNFDYEP